MFRQRVVQQVLAWTLLLIVALVCISPMVDLEACTLRAQNDASVLFWLLTAAFFLLVLGVNIDAPPRSIRLAAVAGDIIWTPPDLEVFTLASAWRI